MFELHRIADVDLLEVIFPASPDSIGRLILPDLAENIEAIIAEYGFVQGREKQIFARLT
jgi:hypothetical protein